VDKENGHPGAVRTALVTIARGFLIGVGFSLALAGTWVVLWHWTMHTEQAAIAEIPGANDAKTIILSNVEEQKHDGLTAIVGSATNTGKAPARGLTIQADFFDHGKFVDQYSTYISGKIAPGESKNFKISCGCRDSPPAEHDSYKVAVIGGY
jgi:hypothetical protein